MLLEDIQPKCRKRRANAENDQYYLLPDRMQMVMDWIKGHDFFPNVARTMDPCAGDGAICQHFPGIKMYDLDPKGENITQQDFLGSNHAPDDKLLAIMNPPFGFKARLAVDFFNKGAEFAEYIAGVFPGSFARPDMQRKMSATHTLVDMKMLPDCSFWLPSEGGGKEPYHVPAVAMIWKRQQREIPPERKNSEYFKISSNPEGADFAVTRSGYKSGTVRELDSTISRGTHYFVTSFIDVETLKRAFASVDWNAIRKGTGANYVNIPQFYEEIDKVLARG